MSACRKYSVFMLMAVLSLSLAGCETPSRKDYEAVQANLAAVSKELEATKSRLQKDNEALKTQLDTARADIKKLQDAAAAQSATLTQTQARASQLEKQLNTVLDTRLTAYYRLTYQNVRYEWDLPVTLRSYFESRDKARAGEPTRSGTMVIDASPVVDALVRSIKDSSIRANLKPSDVVNLVAKLTQSLPRINKDVDTAMDDYARYPVETLVDQAGDSQDTSILAAALLSRLDYDTVLFYYAAQKHMSVGVYMPGTLGFGWEHKGKRYYELETTGDGWTLGKGPFEFRPGVTPVVVPLRE